MAVSTCGKCGTDGFEAVEVTPEGGDHPVVFVQCASCGSVVGVYDGVETGRLFRQQNAAIDTLARQFGMTLDLEM